MPRPSTATWMRCLTLALLSALPMLARAEPVFLGPTVERVEMGPKADVLLDPEGRLGLEDIRGGEAARRFRPARGAVPSFGMRRGNVWLRFDLERSANDGPRILEVPYRGLTVLEYYAPVAGGGFVLQRGGLDANGTGAGRGTRHPRFRLPPAAPGARTHYLRAASAGPVIVPLVLWTPSAFHADEERDHLLLGAFFGLIIAMLVYDLSAVASLREPVYLWHAVSMGLFGLALLTETGLARVYLWPDASRWDAVALPFFVGLATASFVPFARGLLETQRHAPRIDAMLFALVGFALVLSLVAVISLAGPVGTYRVVLTLTMCLAGASMAAALPAALESARSGHPPARHLLAGFLAIAAMGAVVVLENAGLIGRSWITIASMPIGIGAFLFATTLGLSERVAMLRREKEEAQYVAAHDLLTGIANRRSFHETLAREWGRSQRNGQPLSLIMMDLDHFKSINDAHGHLGGDACLRVVAETLDRTLLRPSDTVARYGGEEFAVVLPETDEIGARLVAERLRSAVEDLSIPLGLPGREGAVLTLSLGCATSRCDAWLDAQELLAAADAALYRSKSGGRNRVVSAPVGSDERSFPPRSYAAAPDDPEGTKVLPRSDDEQA